MHARWGIVRAELQSGFLLPVSAISRCFQTGRCQLRTTEFRCFTSRLLCCADLEHYAGTTGVINKRYSWRLEQEERDFTECFGSRQVMLSAEVAESSRRNLWHKVKRTDVNEEITWTWRQLNGASGMDKSRSGGLQRGLRSCKSLSADFNCSVAAFPPAFYCSVWDCRRSPPSSIQCPTKFIICHTRIITHRVSYAFT